MSFITIPNSLIQVGKAVKREIFKLAKDNLDDHESRINAIETSGSSIELLNNDVVLASSAASLTGVLYYKAPFAFTVNTVEIQIFTKGSISSGILEVDVLTNDSPDNSGMQSIFTTEPSIDFSTAVDYAVSTNQVINSAIATLSVGDFLRFDVISLPVGLGRFRILMRGTL